MQSCFRYTANFINYTLICCTKHRVPVRTITLYRKHFAKQDTIFQSLQKQNRIMEKIMVRDSREMKAFNMDMIGMTLFRGKHRRKGQSSGPRRAAMLNNLLLETVTDVMSSGKFSYELFDRGIEITKVMLTAKADAVNVHWKCADTEANVQELLDSVAPKIRNEILQMRVMGRVPYISFVPDDADTMQIKIETLFQKADYGEGYEPMKSAIQTTQKVTDTKEYSLQEQINRENTKEQECDESSVKMDVFGLDHGKMMKRVKVAMEKSKGLHRVSYQVEGSSEGHVGNQNAFYSKSKEFADYLVQRRKDLLKLQKEEQKQFKRKFEVVQGHDHIDNDVRSEVDDDSDYIDET